MDMKQDCMIGTSQSDILKTKVKEAHMIRDRFDVQPLTGVKIPKLKGHVKLTLHNCRTGKNEVYEGENIVTNAVSDIFANNHLGAINYSSLLPLWSNWYGGILCYEQAHSDPTDPDDYYPQARNVSALTAHAGDIAYTGADDMSRGSPLTDSTSQILTESSVKQTWEWGTTQGNGYIRAISLTHKDTGNFGLGAESAGFASFSPFENITGTLSTQSFGAASPHDCFIKYDANHCLSFHIGGTFEVGHTKFATTEFTIAVKKLAISEAGLHDLTLPSTTYQREFTLTLPFTVYCQPSYYFDDTNKYLWIFSNLTAVNAYSNTTVNYAVIDCENETVTDSGTIVSDTATLAPTSMEKNSASGWDYDTGVIRFANIKVQNGYVWFPTSSGADFGYGSQSDSKFNVTGFKKININNQSDQSTITASSTIDQFAPAFSSGNIIVGLGYVVNGDKVYSCANPISGNNTTPFCVPQAPTTLVTVTNGKTVASSGARYMFANKLVNTTKFNLDSPAQKLSSQRMTIDYTLTEITS